MHINWNPYIYTYVYVFIGREFYQLLISRPIEREIYQTQKILLFVKIKLEYSSNKRVGFILFVTYLFDHLNY